MPNFNAHSLSNVLTYPLFYIGFTLTIRGFRQSLEVSQNLLGLGFIVFIAGGMMPDFDAPQSLIRRFVKPFFVAVSATFIYTKIIRPAVFEELLELLPLPETLIVFSLFCASVLLGMLLSTLFNLLKHRGFLHNYFAAALFGLIVFFLYFTLTGGSYGVSIEPPEFQTALYLGASGTLGYATHLIVDKVDHIRKKLRKARTRKNQ